MKKTYCDIRNVDCMDLMSSYEDNYFDLAIVDPPYGIDAANMTMGSSFKKGIRYISNAAKLRKTRFSHGSGKLRTRILNKENLNWDSRPPSDSYFQELFRVSKDQIIWGGNYFDLPPTRGIICWDKKQSWKNFSQWEMAWTSFNMPASIFSMSNCGTHLGKKIHPTQKPVALYKWLLAEYGEKAFKILDTHMGSGSSVVAAYEMGFHITASEIDKSYFQDACVRIENETKQKQLF